MEVFRKDNVSIYLFHKLQLLLDLEHTYSTQRVIPVINLFISFDFHIKYQLIFLSVSIIMFILYRMQLIIGVNIRRHLYLRNNFLRFLKYFHLSKSSIFQSILRVNLILSCTNTSMFLTSPNHIYKLNLRMKKLFLYLKFCISYFYLMLSINTF